MKKVTHLVLQFTNKTISVKGFWDEVVALLIVFFTECPALVGLWEDKVLDGFCSFFVDLFFTSEADILVSDPCTDPSEDKLMLVPYFNSSTNLLFNTSFCLPFFLTDSSWLEEEEEV